MGFNAALGLYTIVWGFVLATFFFIMLRTNIVRALIIGFASLGTFLISGAYWRVAAGDLEMAMRLQKVRSSVSAKSFKELTLYMNRLVAL